MPPTQPRFTLSAYGVFAATSTDYQGTRTFDAFAEEGSITTDYEGGTGPGGESASTWRFARNFGVGVAGDLVSRDATATYTANVPHPLYLNRSRTAEGTVDVDYQETRRPPRLRLHRPLGLARLHACSRGRRS